MTYGVIVCTKCRKQAQIIDCGISKTTRCQRCNATLITRKIRVFFSSENLDEAISARTQIQAQIAEKGTYTLQTEKEKGDRTLHQVFGSEIDSKTSCFADNRKVQKKKKADEVIIKILLANNKEMSHNELKIAALAIDVDGGKFEDALQKMLQAGEIYSPSKGLIKIV
ncbi:hypothetical protein [Methanolobus sp.]|uniref:DUF5817 domain-containing protein n=1 Tax=Methanolobus sp. TaxID=1874737 RepID=UPI0025FBEA5F|nr:hypothetical protein [Methanolobus sp.]